MNPNGASQEENPQGESSQKVQNEPDQPAPEPQAVPVPYGQIPSPIQRHTWQSRLLGISFAIFAFEIGLFLVVFPWMGDAWDLNYFQSGMVLRSFWSEPYFRGAVSGIGFINIYIALLQIARLFRRAS